MAIFSSKVSGFGAARAGLTLAATLLGGAAYAQDSCALQRVHLCAGCTVQRTMTVQKNMGCHFQNDIGSVIFDVRVRVAPKHGVFGKANQALQAYLPRKGYVGSDYFVYEIFFEQYGKRVSTVIHNQVTVTPERPY